MTATAAYVTKDEVFAHGPVTVWDWETGIYLLNGHLTTIEIDSALAVYNASNDLDDDIALIPGAFKHTWSQFTAGSEDGEHEGFIETTAAAGTEGAIAVTWAYVYYPDSDFTPDYSQPDQADAFAARLRELGWFADAA